jgi:hypothetical protein
MLGCLLEMKQANYGRDVTRVEINDSEQAKLLTNPESFRFFEPFMARDCTVSQAAKEVKCKVDTMLYRVNLFLKVGLLKVVKTQARRGRSVKVYRSSSDAYYVPFEITPYEDVEAFFTRSRRANDAILVPQFAKVIRQIGREGRQIYRDEKGEVWTSSAGNVNDISISLEDTEAVRQNLESRKLIGANSSDILYLTEEEARAFVIELYKVWGKYKREDKSKRKPYFLEFAFVPMDE